MSEETAPSPAEWASRRRARASQARGGGATALGVLLAVAGVALGLRAAFTRDVLEGAAIAVISAMLGIVILLVGSLLVSGRD